MFGFAIGLCILNDVAGVCAIVVVHFVLVVCAACTFLFLWQVGVLLF